jgi:hypothetical protein
MRGASATTSTVLLAAAQDAADDSYHGRAEACAGAEELHDVHGAVRRVAWALRHPVKTTERSQQQNNPDRDRRAFAFSHILSDGGFHCILWYANAASSSLAHGDGFTATRGVLSFRKGTNHLSTIAALLLLFVCLGVIEIRLLLASWRGVGPDKRRAQLRKITWSLSIVQFIILVIVVILTYQ